MTELLPATRRAPARRVVVKLAGVGLLGLAGVVLVDAWQGGALLAQRGVAAGGLEATLYRVAAVLVLVGLGGLLLAPEPQRRAPGRLIE